MLIFISRHNSCIPFTVVVDCDFGSRSKGHEVLQTFGMVDFDDCKIFLYV